MHRRTAFAEWIGQAEPMRADASARAIVDCLPAYPIISAATVERFESIFDRVLR